MKQHQRSLFENADDGITTSGLQRWSTTKQEISTDKEEGTKEHSVSSDQTPWKQIIKFLQIKSDKNKLKKKKN